MCHREKYQAFLAVAMSFLKKRVRSFIQTFTAQIHLLRVTYSGGNELLYFMDGSQLVWFGDVLTIIRK